MIKKKKNNNEQRENVLFNIRLVACGIVATLGFFIVAGHLAIIQFIEGKN